VRAATSPPRDRQAGLRFAAARCAASERLWCLIATLSAAWCCLRVTPSFRICLPAVTLNFASWTFAWASLFFAARIFAGLIGMSILPW